MYRHLVAVAALALAVVGPAAACGSESVSPLPTEPSGQPLAASSSQSPASTSSQPPSATPSASTPRANPPTSWGSPPLPTPTKTRSRPPTNPASSGPPSSCMGAIQYDLDLRNTAPLPTSLCFATGAVLRIQGVGPDEISVEPTNLVSGDWEAGVEDIRFTSPGTVTVTVPQDTETHTITVVVR
jgi:hypothetical protein